MASQHWEWFRDWEGKEVWDKDSTPVSLRPEQLRQLIREPRLVLRSPPQNEGLILVSKSSCAREEFEQRAGEGSLSCDSDDAAPARDIGRTQSRANGSVRTCSSRSCQEPQEGGRLGTPAATNLNSEYDEVASRRAR